MIIRRTHIFPTALDNEVRSILEESVRTAQSQGRRTSLQLQLPIDGGFVFVITNVFENLEAFEKNRDNQISDPAFRDSSAKLSSMTRRGARVELYNVLTGGDISGAPRYYLRTKLYPSMGKESEVQSILEEAVKAREAEGRTRQILTRQILAPEFTAFVAGEWYETLAEYENDRVKQLSPALQTAIGKLSPILRSPIEVSMFEILIPFTD